MNFEQCKKEYTLLHNELGALDKANRIKENELNNKQTALWREHNNKVDEIRDKLSRMVDIFQLVNSYFMLTIDYHDKILLRITGFKEKEKEFTCSTIDEDGNVFVHDSYDIGTILGEDCRLAKNDEIKEFRQKVLDLFTTDPVEDKLKDIKDNLDKINCDQ